MDRCRPLQTKRKDWVSSASEPAWRRHRVRRCPRQASSHPPILLRPRRSSVPWHCNSFLGLLMQQMFNRPKLDHLFHPAIAVDVFMMILAVIDVIPQKRLEADGVFLHLQPFLQMFLV